MDRGDEDIFFGLRSEALASDDDGKNSRAAKGKTGVGGALQSECGIVSFFLRQGGTLDEALKFKDESNDFNLATLRERLELFALTSDAMEKKKTETCSIISDNSARQNLVSEPMSVTGDTNSLASPPAEDANRVDFLARLASMFGPGTMGAYLDLIPSHLEVRDDSLVLEERAGLLDRRYTNNSKLSYNANARSGSAYTACSGVRPISTDLDSDAPPPHSCEDIDIMVSARSRRTPGIVLGTIILPDMLYDFFRSTAGAEFTGLLDVMPSSSGERRVFWNPDISSPQDLGPDIKLKSGKLSINSGTLIDLVYLLTEACDDIHRYVESFIYLHRHFASSVDVMRILVIRHLLADTYGWKNYACQTSEVSASLSKTQLQSFRRLRVINVLRRWMSIRQDDFVSNSVLVLIARKFLEYHNLRPCSKEIFTSNMAENLRELSREAEPDASTCGRSCDQATDAASYRAHEDAGSRGATSDQRPKCPNSESGEKHPESRMDLLSPCSQQSTLLSQSLKLERSNTVGTFSIRRGSSTMCHPGSYLLRKKSHILAQQLCLIDQLYLKKINADELTTHLWNAGGPQVLKRLTSNLMCAVNWFNKTAKCIATTILAEDSSRARSKLMDKFIKTAVVCLEYYNFSSCFAIYSGLSSSPIIRLKRSWSKVSRSSKAMWELIQGAISTKGSYNAYRLKLSEAIRKGSKCAFIPYLGIIMSDVTFADIGNKSFTPADPKESLAPINKNTVTVDDIMYVGNFGSYFCASSTRVNFSKFKIVHKFIKIVDEAKCRSYSFALKEDIHEFLMGSWPFIEDEDELINISRRLEPTDASLK